MDGQKARLVYGLNTKREINLVMMYANINAMIGFALGRILRLSSVGVRVA